MATLLWILALSFASLLSVSEAGETCGFRYCEHGCCDYDDSECCDEVTIGAIVGLCVAAGVVIAVIVVIIICCRRRRHRGIVYRNQPGNTIVVQQGVTTNTGYVTTGMQPGIVYPPYQPYAPQPGVMHPPYPQTAIGQAYPPPGAMAQGPPSYDSLSFPNQQPQGFPAASGGVVNQSFNEPQKN